MNVRVKALPGVRAMPMEPSAEELALISAEFSPTTVTADQIHVRRAKVSHNQYDRTLERFQKAHLDRFAETLRGKSMLPGHNTAELPLGRWFDADCRTRTEDFPMLVRPMGKGVEIVPGMETMRQRVTWLEAKFYFANDASTEGLRKNIDLGVYQDVSIGFSFDDVDCDVCKKSYLRSDCPHYRGQKLDDGSLVTLTYSGDPRLYEAREASIVYLGAQQHAELMKSLRHGAVDPETLSRCTVEGQPHTDLMALKEYEALARAFGHTQKSWSFPQLSPPVGEAPPPSVDGAKDDDPAAVAATGEMDMKLLEAARKAYGLPDTATEEDAEQAIKAAADALETAQAAAKTAADEKAALQPMADLGAKALEDLKAEYVEHCQRLKQNETEAGAIADLFIGRKEYDKLKDLVAAKFAEVCEKYPAGISGQRHTPNAPEKPSARPEEVRHLALAG